MTMGVWAPKPSVNPSRVMRSHHMTCRPGRREGRAFSRLGVAQAERSATGGGRCIGRDRERRRQGARQGEGGGTG